ncbi:cache domain-containing sensor histidine kinase [Butyrivibrio sp. CB08]|uniref:cache domain-containing sensor histidine kinase n=1 Tax=Butyrivibrio sp. CB08 TaxID=2364879 RepID=UPI0026928656
MEDKSVSKEFDKLRSKWKLERYMRNAVPRSIQVTISVSFTIVALVCMLAMGVALYNSFSVRSEKMLTDSAELTLDQTVLALEDYLRSMRRMSDAIYYNVIKDQDISRESPIEQMNLLYEAHKDYLISLALYTEDGQLVCASPVAVEKPEVDVTTQDWFKTALARPENLHFSLPHVQNIFVDDPTFRYYWVTSLSRAVELGGRGVPEQGVLLVDMNYAVIKQMLEGVNDNPSEQYVYLCDNSGAIIYHPMLMQIEAGLYRENNSVAASYDDGSHKEEFMREKRIVTVKTMSYTGWKLVSVIPTSNSYLGMKDIRYFVMMILSITLLAMLILNRMVARRVTRPITKLNDSIREIEMGKVNPSVYIGGPSEIEHLGKTLRRSYDQIDQLMKDMVASQEEKRKSELDALQSQINPHFLYNTLDSIVWMIEGAKYDEAVFMITQLASLFRVSLSSGKTIIPIEDEIRHASNYMNIQKVRFKDAFTIDFDIDEEIKNYCTVKLIVQPILENAVYYGVKDMEDGEIRVKGFKGEDGDIYITVSDNGFGMSSEQLEFLLTDDTRVRKKGSGVGLINVQRRIQLRFGQEYGLKIESEPDEGCVVTIHLPAIEYTEENRKALESGKERGDEE